MRFISLPISRLLWQHCYDPRFSTRLDTLCGKFPLAVGLWRGILVLGWLDLFDQVYLHLKSFGLFPFMLLQNPEEVRTDLHETCRSSEQLMATNIPTTFLCYV